MQRIDDIQVRRISQGDDDRIVVFGHGHSPVPLGHMPRHGGNDVVGQANIAEVDEFKTEMGRLGLGHIHGFDDFFLQQKVEHPIAVGGSGGLFPHGRNLLFGQLPHVNQQINQIIVFGGHVSLLFLRMPDESLNLSAFPNQVKPGPTQNALSAAGPFFHRSNTVAYLGRQRGSLGKEPVAGDFSVAKSPPHLASEPRLGKSLLQTTSLSTF